MSIVGVSSADIQAIGNDISDIRSTIIVGFMGFTILVWDHIITFDDEITYIWQRRKGPICYLFLLNRYLIPLGFILNLFAYLWPGWTNETCNHFVRYEGSMTVIGINVASLLMLMRIRAIYNDNMYVVGFVAIVLAVEFIVNTILLTHGVAVSHSGPIHPCTMVFSPDVKAYASASAWLPLIYDTTVFILTIFRTVQIRRRRKDFRSPILDAMLKEGIMYYSVIFTINVILTFMIGFAPPNLQNITAQLELLLTTAMMSRITLDLKKASYGQIVVKWRPSDARSPVNQFGSSSLQDLDNSQYSTVVFRSFPEQAGANNNTIAQSLIPMESLKKKEPMYLPKQPQEAMDNRVHFDPTTTYASRSPQSKPNITINTDRDANLYSTVKLGSSSQDHHSGDGLSPVSDTSPVIFGRAEEV